MSFPEKIKQIFVEGWFRILHSKNLQKDFLKIQDDVLDCYSEDQKELIKAILKESDIIDEFAFLVKEYALVDDDKLTKDAIELKHKILKVLEIGQEERKQKLQQLQRFLHDQFLDKFLFADRFYEKNQLQTILKTILDTVDKKFEELKE